MPSFAWGWGYPAAEPEVAPLSAAPPPVQSDQAPYGTLRVEVLAAAAAQVYVDGYYAAMADQAAAGLDLEPGPHRVEVRAAGYEPLTFDVRVTPNQVITFRDAMRPLASTAAAPQPAPKAAAPSTFYVIAGCYVGNVPPVSAKLPEGCDAKNVQTFKQ
jgi:PEGA domain